MSTSTDVDEIPLRPESIVSLAWGLSLYFSKKDQEKKYGEELKKTWDGLLGRYSGNKKALLYLDNVNAVLSGAVYDLARLRQDVIDRFLYLDEMEKKRIGGLDDLASLSKDLQSITSRILGLSIGGGLTFIGLATNVFGPRQLVFTILGAAFSYALVEVAFRLYRLNQMPKILKQTQGEKDNFLEKQFGPKSESILKKLLDGVNKVLNDIYGKKSVISSTTLDKLSNVSAEEQKRIFQSRMFVTSNALIVGPDYVVEKPPRGHDSSPNPGSMG